MKNKATHYGHCQCCDSRQKLPGGMLSTHGYTVAQGFFEGVCQGSGFKPYEKSFDLIELFIKNAKDRKKFFLSEIARLEQKTDTKDVPVKAYDPGNRFLKSGYYWRTVEIISQERSNSNDYKWTEHGYMTAGRNGSNENRFSKVDTYTTRDTVENVVKYLCQLKIKDLRAQIVKVDTYISWQKGRIYNWKECDLMEVKP